MEPVSIRAAYERFPVSIKGAFLVRGSDGLPHQVRIESARASGCSAEGDREIGIEPMVLEVAPTQDTFVPFEVSTIDIPAGWYRLTCEVVVDGTAFVMRPGAPFASPWPRASVRRGTVTIDQKAGGVVLETLECVSDGVRIAFAADDAPIVDLQIDGQPHPVLDVEFDAAAGRGVVVGYPALRSQGRLKIRVRGESPTEVALP